MKQSLIIILLIFALKANAQEDRTVTLVVSGQGKTQEEAKQNALRSAIEQAFGAFISSKTEILNDSLVKDEIVSVTNGNIQKYELLSEGVITEGYYSVTLSAIVSVSKLTSFCESKGVEILFNGDLLSSNIQLIEINKDAEFISIKNLTKLSKDWLKKCFDYSLITSDPTYFNGNYKITLTVSTLLNSEFSELNKYMINTLKFISMSNSEISKYDKLMIDYYQIQILDLNKVPNTFYFRNMSSVNEIFSLFEHPEDYLQNFQVFNNFDTISGIKFQKVIRIDERSAISKEFNSSGIVVKYNFFDLKICQYREGDSEAEYIACLSQWDMGQRNLYPQQLVYNRFPIMIVKNYGSKLNIKQNLQISFFCPLDKGMVSLRKFDYFFNNEEIKSINKFTVKSITALK